MSYEGHEAVPPHRFDEWTDAAFDCLQQYCERGIPGSSLAIKMVEEAFTDQDANRLQALVAKFEPIHILNLIAFCLVQNSGTEINHDPKPLCLNMLLQQRCIIYYHSVCRRRFRAAVKMTSKCSFLGLFGFSSHTNSSCSEVET